MIKNEANEVMPANLTASQMFKYELLKWCGKVDEAIASYDFVMNYKDEMPGRNINFKIRIFREDWIMCYETSLILENNKTIFGYLKYLKIEFCPFIEK